VSWFLEIILARISKTKIYLISVWMLICVVSYHAQAGEERLSDSFTPEEKAWLKAHPVILAAPDPDFPPTEYFDKNGQYQGIAADYLALIEKKIGIRFKIVRLKNWDEVLEKAKLQEIDMVTAATRTPQREKYLRFTSSFIDLPSVIIVRQNVSRELDLEDLMGMKVAVVHRYAAHDYINNLYPDMDLYPVPDSQTGLRKVSFGMVDAMVTNIATASYNIEKEKITNLRMAGKSGFVYRLAFAPIRGNWELNSILEKGLSLITSDERRTIYRKWITLERDSLLKSKKFWVSISAVLGIVFFFAVGVLVWNRTLRRRVEEKTAALKLEVMQHQKAKIAIEESEARYRQVIENTRNGVAVFKAVDDGNDFIFLELNKSGEKIDQIKKADVIGRSIMEIYPEIKSFGLFDIMQRVWADGQPQYHPVALYKDNRIAVWRESFVYKLPSGEIATVYGDESKLKALQAETMRASHLASIGELAAGVAHEINNPANSVINLAQVLVNESAPPSLAHDVAGRILKEGDRIASIVGSLLAFARDRNVRKNPVDVADIVDETLALTEAQVRKDGITLQVDVPDGLPLINGHMQQIQQVFLNIITNARHALNEKYPGRDENKLLMINAKVIRNDGRLWIHTTFTDHGVGIRDEIMEHVMDPFFTTKPAGIGTGLGLSIAHGIIVDHGGKLRIESDPGVFTQMIIELPVGGVNERQNTHR
jgi:signal transduction histidine kinase/ABC-type amino acid transport substrate-binding protein